MRRLLIILALFSVSAGFAQTARDYFFPARDKNLSVHVTNIKDSDPYLTNTYVKDFGDSALITTQSNLVVNINNTSRPGTWEQMVKITPLEIIALHGKAKTKNGVERFNNDGEILFKIPPKKSEVVEWSDPRQKGAMKTVYRAEFATIKVDKKKMKAVKVTFIQKRKHNGEEWAPYADYYVLGIGRYKRIAGMPGEEFELEALTKQTHDENVPTVN